MNNYTSPEDSEFFASIGRLVISWAHLEAGIDFSIMTIYKKFGNKVESELPRSLSRKLKYLKSAAKLAELSSFSADLISISNDVHKASDTRHDIIHGFVTEHPAEGFDKVSFARIIQDTDFKTLNKTAFSTLEVLQESVKIMKISGRALSLSTALRSALSAE